jgi:hypothetical protein
MEKLLKRSKTWMILAVLIGFICCVFLCITRHQIEQQNRSFEMSMDYDAVLAMAHNDGYDTDTTVAKLKEAGLTSFAIYDTTLNKLTQRGDASLITKMGARLYYPQFDLQNQPFEYYLIGKPKDTTDLYFDEVYEDLQLRLGSKNAVLIDNPQYRIIGLHGNMPTLGEINLGILSADANQIAKNGFHVILRPTNYSNVTAAKINAFFRRADKIHNVSGIMFVGKEVLGFSHDLAERKELLTLTAQQMEQRQIPFYMIEATGQLQYDNQEGMYDLAGLLHYDTTRVYAMSKEELDKIAPAEASMRFYISDLERNVRVNQFPLYKKPANGLSITDTNLQYVAGVSNKLKERGDQLGQASVLPAYYPAKILLILASVGAACGFLFTLNLLLPLPEKYNYVLLVLGVIGAAAGAAVAKGALFLQIMAIGCATAAPTASILVLLDWWKSRQPDSVPGYGRVLRDGTVALACAVVMSMIGGIYIAAMLGNIRFFMEFDFYRGVKLTILLPIILGAIGYLRRFPLLDQTVTTPAEFIAFSKKVLNIPIKMGTLMIVAVIGLMALVFVGRSGHTAGVPVPGVEVAMRRFLENIMYARPREKEFLVGHPAFYLMVAALYRKWPQVLHFFLVLGAVIGQGSMVETFAHIRTPFMMSFIRGINGWLAGMVIGIAVICFLALLQYMTGWFGKQVKQHD